MLGALFSNANAAALTADDFVTKEEGKAVSFSGYYLLGDGTNGFLKAKTITGQDKAKYTVLDGTGLKTADVTSLDAIPDEALWKILPQLSTTPGSSTLVLGFQFENKKTGKVLTLKDETAIPKDNDNMSTGVLETFNWFAADKYTASTGKYDVSAGATITMTTNGVKLEAEAATSVAGTAQATTLFLYKVNANPISAETLNKACGGLGFSLAVSGETATENPFAVRMKAFDVASDLQVETGDATNIIPAGTYFATSYPKELAAKNAITSSEVADFMKCTFIAIDPAEHYDDINGMDRPAGLKFTTVKGSEFNTYALGSEDDGYDEKNLSAGSDVFVGNAAFSVIEKDPITGVGKYTIAASAIRYKEKADKDKQVDGSVNIAYVKTDKCVTTGGTAATFVINVSTLVRPYELLKDTAVATVFNIQFTSKTADSDEAKSEYGKYLSLGSDGTNAFELRALGSAMVNLKNPQYQFVVAAVDSSDNKVIFTLANRENRATTIVCQLYKAEKNGEYIVALEGSTQFKAAYVDANNAVTYTSAKPLNGTTIKLLSATVDKYAGYVNRTADQIDPVTFKFAKDITASSKLFIGVKNEGGYSLITDKNEAKAAQFELVKNAEDDDVVYGNGNFVYLKNGKATKKTDGDTIAVYTYKVKLYNAEGANVYLKGDLSFGNESAAADFIIKENLDGSIALIKLTTDYATTIVTTVTCVAYDSENEAIKNDNTVYASKANYVPLFMIEETPAVSLKAEDRHVAFNAATGFISINDKNQAVMAPATEASSALTFWLDSADSKASIPSFFISAAMDKTPTKAEPAADAARLYLYHAADSANYSLTGVDLNYMLPDGVTPRLIFKAATLINSDTLSTNVKGKTALVAAEKDLDGTLEGLNYFKYQIVKAQGSDDEYVIRCKGNRKYIQNINGVLTANGSLAEAMTVTLDEGIATSNDATPSVSEVKVIAAEGAIRIAGAQGKKVVISNILGQVIANTVISSSDATIAAPAGIVVVAVEGEEAVKAIVK